MLSITLAIFFGIIGMGYFGYGKKNAWYSMLCAGVLLMVFPYIVTDWIAMGLAGLIIIASPFTLKHFGFDF